MMPVEPARQQSSTGDAPRVVRFGPYEADFRNGELHKHGRRIRIQAKPLSILDLLVRRRGEIVSRDDLRKALWPDDVFVDFEKNVNTAVNKLRSALCDTADAARYIETVPRRGYRFLGEVEVVEEAGGAQPERESVVAPAVARAAEAALPAAAVATIDVPAATVAPRPRRRVWLAVAAVAGLAVLVAGAASLLLYRARPPQLAERDTIVVAEVDNRTGDRLFDGTLRQALASQMEESHFVNVLSEARIAETLALMARGKDTRLSGDVARTVCARTGSVATIEGSIANFGGQYAIWLNVVSCSTGDLLASEQVTAAAKDRVLAALASGAIKLRGTLGEKLAGVQKTAAPPEKVTTTSLEALQAYTLGYRTLVVANESEPAIPFFQRAIDLDPNFAMAYARLGKCYDSVDQAEMAATNFRKAAALRDRASEHERFYIDAYYDYIVTGDFEAAREHFESWAQVFRGDAQPHASLGNIYSELGDYERSLAERETALRLDGSVGLNHGNLVWSNVWLGRYGEARRIARGAQARGLDSPSIHVALLLAAWAEGDATTLKREFDGLMGRPGAEEAALAWRQAMAMHAGQFRDAERLARQAADAHLRRNEPEGAARVQAALALGAALAGRTAAARQAADFALSLSKGKETRGAVALVRALAGDVSDANRVESELNQAFPSHTVVQRNYLPALRAAMALRTKAPTRAVAALEAASPYERGQMGFFMLPVYLRGVALRTKGDAAAAATEFRKIVDYPGPVTQIIGVLARLELARALAAADDTVGAKESYKAFLDAWRNADDDTGLLHEARREYSALR